MGVGGAVAVDVEVDVDAEVVVAVGVAADGVDVSAGRSGMRPLLTITSSMRALIWPSLKLSITRRERVLLAMKLKVTRCHTPAPLAAMRACSDAPSSDHVSLTTDRRIPPHDGATGSASMRSRAAT